VSKQAVVYLASALCFALVGGHAMAQSPLLEPGTVTARAMPDEDVHEYRVSVQAGQALRVRVTQFGLDVVVAVFNPQGTQIVEVDSPTGSGGDEDVTVVAMDTGDHVVRVKPSKSPGGRYELRVESPRTPTLEDRQRAELLQLLYTSARLLESDDVAQRADTVRRIQQAIAAARRSGHTSAVHALFGRLLGADPRAALASLELPTVHGKVTVHYSRGHEARARTLQARLTRAADYFAERLQVRPTIVMAVLAREDADLLGGPVYGFPWSDGGRWSSIVVLPATHAIFDEIAATIGRQAKAATAIAQAEGKTGLSLVDGVRLAADSIMYHELGHIFASAYGIGDQNLWFGEFVAAYFAEAYKADVKPDPREPVFERLLGYGSDDSSPPTYTALEDMERVYGNMEPANYGWYQGQFTSRARAVYNAKGFAFLHDLKTVLPKSAGERLPVAEVLSRLEQISPGFVAWANSLAEQSRTPASRR
jgi:hypothetical protein